MRYILLIALLAISFAACKKDKFTTVPQIKFKSLKPNAWSSGNTILQKDFAPVLTVSITDAEGDLGFKSGSDTSKIYIKNLVTNKIDSPFLPDIKTAGKSNFQADITFNLYSLMGEKPGVTTRPRVDTLYFEIYVTDFAKNKSNVIKTDKPVFYFVE
jgi:hypothetical protein